MGKRERGRIKNWFQDRAFGFTTIDSYCKDVFLHISNLRDKNIKPEQLDEGVEIECKVVKTEKGYSCVDVVILKDDKTIFKKVKKEKEVEDKKSSRETDNKMYCAPRDTVDIIKSNRADCENICLLLKKFPIIIMNDDKSIKEVDKLSFENINEKTKATKYYDNANELYLTRIKNVLTNRQIHGYRAEIKQYKVDWRLVVGLGEASVYETSIRLHHIYGFPYIPSSSFRGSVRSWVINKEFGGNEDEAFKDDFFTYVFGCPKTENKLEQKGNVIFYDANPSGEPKIDIDIINTHYADYYRDGMSSPPGDYSNPNLVNFLTVKKTTFEFCYGYNTEFDISKCETTKFEKTLVEQMNIWIKDSLNYQGLGAKTSVGYGFFTEES